MAVQLFPVKDEEVVKDTTSSNGVQDMTPEVTDQAAEQSPALKAWQQKMSDFYAAQSEGVKQNSEKMAGQGNDFLETFTKQLERQTMDNAFAPSTQSEFQRGQKELQEQTARANDMQQLQAKRQKAIDDQNQHNYDLFKENGLYQGSKEDFIKEWSTKEGQSKLIDQFNNWQEGQIQGYYNELSKRDVYNGTFDEFKAELESNPDEINTLYQIAAKQNRELGGNAKQAVQWTPQAEKPTAWGGFYEGSGSKAGTKHDIPDGKGGSLGTATKVSDDPYDNTYRYDQDTTEVLKEDTVIPDGNGNPVEHKAGEKVTYPKGYVREFARENPMTTIRRHYNAVSGDIKKAFDTGGIDAAQKMLKAKFTEGPGSFNLSTAPKVMADGTETSEAGQVLGTAWNMFIGDKENSLAENEFKIIDEALSQPENMTGAEHFLATGKTGLEIPMDDSNKPEGMSGLDYFRQEKQKEEERRSHLDTDLINAAAERFKKELPKLGYTKAEDIDAEVEKFRLAAAEHIANHNTVNEIVDRQVGKTQWAGLNTAMKSLTRGVMNIGGGIQDSLTAKLLVHKDKADDLTYQINKLTEFLDANNRNDAETIFRGIAGFVPDLWIYGGLGRIGQAGYNAFARTLIANVPKFGGSTIAGLTRIGMEGDAAAEAYTTAMMQRLNANWLFTTARELTSGAVTFGTTGFVNGAIDELSMPYMTFEQNNFGRQLFGLDALPESSKSMYNIARTGGSPSDLWYVQSEGADPKTTELLWKCANRGWDQGKWGALTGLLFWGAPASSWMSKNNRLINLIGGRGTYALQDASKLLINSTMMTQSQILEEAVNTPGDWYSNMKKIWGEKGWKSFAMNTANLGLLDLPGIFNRASKYEEYRIAELQRHPSRERDYFLQKMGIPADPVDLLKQVAEGKVVLPQGNGGNTRYTVQLFGPKKGPDGKTLPLTEQQKNINSQLTGFVNNTVLPYYIRKPYIEVLTGSPVRMTTPTHTGEVRMELGGGQRFAVDAFNDNGEVVYTQFFDDRSQALRGRDAMDLSFGIGDIGSLSAELISRTASATLDNAVASEYAEMSSRLKKRKKIEAEMQHGGKKKLNKNKQDFLNSFTQHEEDVILVSENQDVVETMNKKMENGEPLTAKEKQVNDAISRLYLEHVKNSKALDNYIAEYEKANGIKAGTLLEMQKGFGTKKEALDADVDGAGVVKMGDRWYTLDNVRTLRDFRRTLQAGLNMNDEVQAANGQQAANEIVQAVAEKQAEKGQNGEQQGPAAPQQQEADNRLVTMLNGTREQGKQLQGKDRTRANKDYKRKRQALSETGVDVDRLDEIIESDDTSKLVQMVNGISDEKVRNQAWSYIDAAQRNRGMMDVIKDQIDNEVQARHQEIDNETSDDGNVTALTLNGSGKVVYLKKGQLTVNDDGTVNKSGSEKSLVAYDPETGRPVQISPDDIKSVSVSDAQAEKAAAADEVEQAVKAQHEAELEGTLSFQPGDVYDVAVNGEKKVARLLENNGDGTVKVEIDGQESTMRAEDLQRMADDVYDMEPGEPAAQPETPQQPAVAPQPEAPQKPAQPKTVHTETGDIDYDKSNPADVYDELEQQGEGSAKEMAEQMIAEAQGRLNAANEAKIEGGNFLEKAKSLKARNDAKREAKKALDFWNKVLQEPERRAQEQEQTATPGQQKPQAANDSYLPGVPKGMLDKLAQATGLTVKVGDPKTFINKNDTSRFNYKTRTIEINPDAPMSQRIAGFLGHETWHSFEDMDGAEDFQKFLLGMRYKDQKAIDAAVAEITKNYAKGGIELGNNGKDALNELTANVLKEVLFSGKEGTRRFLQAIDEASGNMNGMQKFVAKMRDWIDQAMEFMGLKDADPYGQTQKQLQEARDQYTTWLKKAQKFNNKPEQVIRKEEPLLDDHGDAAAIVDNKHQIMHNFETFMPWTDNLGQQHEGSRARVIRYMKDNKFSDDDIKKMDDIMMYWYSYLNKISDFTDENGNFRFQAFKDWNEKHPLYHSVGGEISKAISTRVKNGEYANNLELTTDCIKREAFTQLMNTLVNRGADLGAMGPREITVIQDLMKQYGIQVACPLCFVEGKRLQIVNWAQTIVDDWNNALRELQLDPEQVGDFNFGKDGDDFIPDEDLQTIDQMDAKARAMKAVNDVYNLLTADDRLSQKQLKARNERKYNTRYNQMAKAWLKVHPNKTIEDFKPNKNQKKELQEIKQFGINNVNAVERNTNEYAKRFAEMEQEWLDKHPGTDKTFEPTQAQWQELDKIRNKQIRDIKAKMVRLISEYPEMRHAMKLTDLLGSKGLMEIRQQNGKAYEQLYSLILGRFGSGTPKPIQDAVPYDCEVIEISDSTVSKAAIEGGTRMFSFSDYDITKTFDYMQAFFDLAARKMKLQSYTKEAPYVLTFGQTGAKINMSTLPKAVVSTMIETAYRTAKNDDERKAVLHAASENAGLIIGENGKIQDMSWSEEHSLKPDFCKAIFHDDRYNANVGATTVGASVNHAVWAAAQPWIRQVIPFHLSGMPMAARERTDVKWYFDNTPYQNTRVKNSKGEWVSIHSEWAKKHKTKNGGKYEDFNFYEGEDNPGWDLRQRCRDYVQWCKDNDYMPRFEWGLNSEEYRKFCEDQGFEPNQEIIDIMDSDMTDGIWNGYYKYIADFNPYKPVFDEKGNYVGDSPAPHRPVEANFSMDDVMKGILFENENSMLQNRENSIRNATENMNEIADKTKQFLSGDLTEADMVGAGDTHFASQSDADLWLNSQNGGDRAAHNYEFGDPAGKNIPENAGNSGKNSIFVNSMVSPFFEKDAFTEEDSKKLRNSRGYGDYIEQGVKLTTALELPVHNILENRGGYYNRNTGRNTVEVSATWLFPDESDKGIDTETKATMFACMLGDLSPEQQDSVIVYRYADPESNDYDGIEHILACKDVDKAIQTLRDQDIADFTINEKDKSIHLQLFAGRNDVDQINAFKNKVNLLISKLVEDENFDGGRTSSEKIRSRLIDAEHRRDLYQTWLTEATEGNAGRSDWGSVEYALRAAQQRCEQFIGNGKRPYKGYERSGVQEAGNQNPDGTVRIQQGEGRGSGEQPLLERDFSERHDAKTQAFFSGVVNEEKYTDYKFKWHPWKGLNEGQQRAMAAWEPFDGGFSTHINISIPYFREMQLTKINALSQYLKPGQKIIDLCGSQGDFSKSIATLDPGIHADSVDINPDMRADFERKQQVDGVNFVQESVLGRYDDDATNEHYPEYAPEEKGDIVHETMGFQFIMKDRKAFIDRIADKLLKKDGVVILEEKIHPETITEWAYNEAQKDIQFKNHYWKDADVAKKKAEVLTGMGDDQADSSTLIADLKSRFKYVGRYWKSGNFEGYMASNSKANFERLKDLIGDTTNEFSYTSENDTPADASGDKVSHNYESTDEEYSQAVKSGDKKKALELLRDKADKELNVQILPDDSDTKGFKYHLGKAPTKTFKRYAVLNVSPEGFKAAYAGNEKGTPVGVWLDAQNLQSYMSDMVQFDDGSFASYIVGDTGAAVGTKFSKEKQEELGLKGSDRLLLERGGKHSSDVPNFSQMNLKQNEKGEKVTSAKEGALPHNKLIFEIEYGIDDNGDLTEYVKENGRMMKGKNQGLAKIGENQYYDFKTNPNAVGNWGIGGTFRITRLVPHEEIVEKTEQYKKDAIAEAERAYKAGEITEKDYNTRVKNAEKVQVQKWVGGYHPEDFGLTVENVEQMRKEGEKSKVLGITYDDNGNLIPLSERFNPESKDIRHNYESDQDIQIHSDNFKGWFGDWEKDPENASKVVDKDGKPLVVYHGGSIRTKVNDGHMFFMTNSLPSAATYSNKFGITPLSENRELPEILRYDGEGYNLLRSKVKSGELKTTDDVKKLINDIVEVGGGKLHDTWHGSWVEYSNGEKIDITHDDYINWNDIYQVGRIIDQVRDAFTNGTMTESERKRGNFAFYVNMRNPLVVDAKGRGWDRIKFDAEEIAKGHNAMGVVYSRGEVDTNLIAEYAYTRGYDGVIIENINDSRTWTGSIGEPTTDYIVFDPRQIKSATDNNGEFSKTDPDIRHNYEVTDDLPTDKVGSRMRQRRGETVQEYEERKRKYQQGIVESDEQARKRTLDQIQAYIDNKQIGEMGKRDLRKLQVAVKDATPENLARTLQQAQHTINTLQSKVTENHIGRLLRFKVGDTNSRKMSIAKNVDEGTARVVTSIRKMMGDLATTGLEEERREINVRHAELNKQIAELQGQVDSGTFSGSELTDLQNRLAAAKTEIQENETKRADIKRQIDEARANNRQVTKTEVDTMLQTLHQKQSEAAIGNGTWTEADADQLLGYTIMQQRMGMLDALAQKNALDTQRAALQLELNSKLDRHGKPKSGMENDVNSLRQQILDNEKMSDQALLEANRRGQQVVDQLTDLLENGKEKLQAKLEAERQRKSDIILSTWQDFGKTSKEERKLADQHEQKKRESADHGILGKAKGLYNGVLGSFVYLAQHMSQNRIGTDSYFYKHFVEGPEGVLAAQSACLEGTRQSMGELNAKCEELFGKKYLKVLKENEKVVSSPVTRRVDVNGMEVTQNMQMSKGEATYLYMVWKMPDGRIKLEHQGFDELSIEQAKEWIGPENIAWADWVQSEFLVKLREKYNETYRSLFNTSMADIPDYVPLKIDSASRHQDVDVAAENAPDTLDNKEGALMNRTFNLNDVDLTNSAYSVVAEHVQNMEEWNAFARVRQDLNYVLSSTAIRNQLNENESGLHQRLFKAAQIATRTYKPKVPEASKWTNALTKGLAGANIALRNTTALKQMLSLPAFLGYSQDLRFLVRIVANTLGQYSRNTPAFIATVLSMGEFGRDVMKEISNSNDPSFTSKYALSDTFRWCVENIPSFRDRISKGASGNVVLDDMLNSDQHSWHARFVQRLGQNGMAANALVDATTCAIGMKSIYDYRHARLLDDAKEQYDKGLIDSQEYDKKKEEAHRQALAEAEIYINSTQQSNHPAFLAPIQMDGDLASKMFTLYKNSPISYARMAILPAQQLWKMRHYSQLRDEAKKMYLEQGWDDAAAEEKAGRHMVATALSSVVGIGLYGYLMNYLWNWGGQGILGLLQTDDKEDDKDKSTVRKVAEWGAPILNGVPGVDIMMSMAQEKDYNPVLLFGWESDMVKDAKRYGWVSSTVGYDVLNTLTRFGAGVDLNTLTNTYLATEHLMKQGVGAENRAKLLDFMLYMNTPNSNRKKVTRSQYMDEDIDTFFEDVMRADKLCEDTSWHKYLPGVRVINEDQKQAILKEYAEAHATEFQKAMRDKKKADSVEQLLKDYQDKQEIIDAYNKETDPQRKINLGKAYNKLLDKSEKQETAIAQQYRDVFESIFPVEADEQKNLGEREYVKHATINDLAHIHAIQLNINQYSDIDKRMNYLKAKGDVKGLQAYVTEHQAEITQMKRMKSYMSTINKCKNALPKCKNQKEYNHMLDIISKTIAEALQQVQAN